MIHEVFSFLVDSFSRQKIFRGSTKSRFFIRSFWKKKWFFVKQAFSTKASDLFSDRSFSEQSESYDFLTWLIETSFPDLIFLANTKSCSQNINKFSYSFRKFDVLSFRRNFLKLLRHWISGVSDSDFGHLFRRFS